MTSLGEQSRQYQCALEAHRTLNDRFDPLRSPIDALIDADDLLDAEFEHLRDVWVRHHADQIVGGL